MEQDVILYHSKESWTKHWKSLDQFMRNLKNTFKHRMIPIQVWLQVKSKIRIRGWELQKTSTLRLDAKSAGAHCHEKFSGKKKTNCQFSICKLSLQMVENNTDEDLKISLQKESETNSSLGF